MINIVIPMAGAGSRFVEAGYTVPKPFIDVLGKTMVENVLSDLKIDDCQFILIARKEHVLAMEEYITRIKDEYNVSLITIDELTDGAACTVLKARAEIDNDTPLVLANSDQMIDISLADYVNDSDNRKLSGSILTFYSDHPKWSYAQIDDEGYVVDVKEKQVISPHATVGIYYFSKGRDFVAGADEMIEKDDRFNGEFYSAPVYNYLIKGGKKFGIYEIEESQMHGMGTPEDLKEYLAHMAKSYA